MTSRTLREQRDNWLGMAHGTVESLQISLRCGQIDEARLQKIANALCAGYQPVIDPAEAPAVGMALLTGANVTRACTLEEQAVEQDQANGV